MAQKINITSYMRNVGRSMGYAVKDVVSDYTPILTSTISATKSTMSDIKISMQEMKNNNISVATRNFNKNDNFLSNTLDDLKTGKWYNQERKDKADEEMFGLNFDFDDDWGDFDNNDNSSDEVPNTIEHDEINARQIINSVDQVGSNISKSIGYTSARSAEYIVANNRASSKALYDLNARGFNQVSSILLNMNGNVQGLLKLGEPLANHMQNSSVFYLNTTTSLNNINEGVNKINNNLQILVNRTAYMDKKQSSSNSKSGYNNIMSGGEFDASGYIDMVKGNIKEQTDTIKTLIDMMKMTMGENGKNTSLTEMFLKGSINKLIPNIAKDISKQLDETLSASLGNGLMRAGKYARNKGLLGNLLADMFLPKETVKTSVNTANYEKGPIQWDGIARQSLTYVIPTYLAQMTSLLAGVNDEKDYQYYDFKTGKFTTKRIYQRDKEYVDRAKARSAGGEFESLALKSTGNERIQKEIEEFFYQAMLKGGDFYNIKNGKTDASWRKKYGNISEDTVDILLQVLNDANSKGPNKNRNIGSKFESNMNEAIADYARRMKEEEILGYSLENRFNDGTSQFVLRSAVGGGRKSGSGEKNYSVYRNGFEAASQNIRSRGWRNNGNGTYTVGSNDTVISAEDFGKWLTAFESGDTKTARKIENTKAMKDAKEKADNMAKGVGKSILNKIPGGEKITNITDLLERGTDIVQTPMYAVTMAMDTLNRGINNLFWGDGTEKGAIDKLKDKINSTWEKIKSKFDDVFGDKKTRALQDMGLSNLYVDIVKRVDSKGIIRWYGVDEEGKLHRVADSVGEAFEKQTKKKSLSEAMYDEWGKIKDYAKNKLAASRERASKLQAELAQFKEQSAGFGDDNGNAARGRQVTKAGFAIVSEGEMIIPSEFNPNYHGATNKAGQIANEDRIRRNFFGSFANGKVSYNRIGNSDTYTDGKGGYYSYDEESKTYNKLNIKDKDNIKRVTLAYNGAIASSGPAQAIAEGAKTLTSGIMDFVNTVIGKQDKKNSEEEKKNIFAKIKQSFIDAGDEKGALGIGAVTGVGVSLLTGAVVGPLAGAAIGAGVGLAAKSQAFQDLLFGYGDPESEDYHKGLLGSIGEKIKENKELVKSIGISGGVGLAAGTFMGSPILGLITGSTIGYIAKSDKAQKFLFGTEDHKTAIGELKDKIKKSIPNIAAGALAGLVAGPFGVAGNLIVGSALGYASTTNEFHKFMFGDPDDKNDKGLAGKIHDKIVNPIDNIMHNIGIATNRWLKNMGRSIGNRISSFFKDRVRRYKDGDKSLLSRVIGVGEKVITAPINLAGKALGTVDNITTGHNLKKGYNVWNSKEGRVATAEEREQMRADRGIQSSSLDKAIASTDDKEKLISMRNYMQELMEPGRAIKRLKSEELTKLFGVLQANGVSAKDAEKIAKLTKGANGIARAEQYLAGCTISPKTKTAKQAVADIKAAISECNANLLKGWSDADAKKNTRQMLADKFGMSVKDSDLANASALIDDELKNNSKFSDEKQKEIKNDRYHDKVETYLDQILNAITKTQYAAENRFAQSRAGKVFTQKDKTGVLKYYRMGEDGRKIPISNKEGIAALQNDKSRSIGETFYDGKEIIGKGIKTGIDITAETVVEAGKVLGTSAKVISDSVGAVASFIAGQVDNGLLQADDAVSDARDIKDYTGNGFNRAGRKISNIFRRAKGFVKGLFSKKSSDDKESTAGSGTYRSIMRKLSGGSGDDENRKTEFTNNGPVQYVKNSQGEWVVDRSDKETKETEKKQSKFNDAISGIGKITGILGGIGGVLGLIKKGLLGDGDKKPGILSKLFNGLFGDEGPLAGLLGLFTGQKGGIKTIVKSIMAKGGADIIRTLLTDVGIGALIYAGFSGKLDNISSSIVGAAGGKGAEDALASHSISDSRTYDVTLSDGSIVTASKDKDGNFIDANSNILDVKSVNKSNQNNVGSLSDRLKSSTIRGILTNTKTVASTLVSKTSIGKTVGNLAKDGDLGIAVFVQIDDALKSLAKTLSKLPALKNVDLDGMFNSLSSKIGDVITTQGPKFAKFASNAVVFAKIAFAVVDFTTGYEDARTTLGIVKEPTIGQRILSGLLRTVKNIVPIIGTLIPDSLVVDVFCNYIAPALGINVSELKNAREEAQSTVDAYNEATGKNLSVAEFTKSAMKDYTWTERIGNAASRTWQDTKTKAKNFGKSVKENGLIGTFKQIGSDTINAFKESYKDNGGGIAGVWSGIGEAFGNMLPGVIGEIAKANADIKSRALKGDLRGLWDVSLSDFSGGGEDIEGTDIKTAVPSMFSKAIGQIPLIVNKITSTPIALLSKVMGKIKEGLTPIFDSIKNSAIAMKTSFSTGLETLESGEDIKGFLDVSDIKDDEGNPLGGFTTVLCKIARIVTLPVVLVKGIGNRIKNKFDSIKEKIVTGYNNVLENNNTIQEYAKSGDLSSIWSNKITDSDDNPLGGIYEAANFVQKLSATPVGLFHLAGNKIKDALHVNTIKSDATTFSKTLTVLNNYAKSGNLSSIWSTNVKFSDDNPVKEFFSVGITINKVFSSITALFEKIIGPIGNMINGVANKVSGFVDRVGNTVSNVRNSISNGINSAGEWVSNTVDNAANSVSDFVTGGSSGFVNQFDPKYQNYYVSGEKFGAKGCGPAVASMAASALGKNLSVGDAVKASNGYQTNDGVTLDYFQNALGSRGINTEIIAGGSSADIYRKIANGQKVILLGQDSQNTSKANSPFGPNNHYVLATGVDRRGNVIINDPEANRPRIYNPSILTHTKYGIAGSNSGIIRKYNNNKSRRFRLIAGGGECRNDAITQQIWAYLTTQLGMTEAAAAGVMGNMQQESGCTPNMHQVGGPAYGLCQWEGERKTALMQKANYQNLNVQLDYMASELPSQPWKKSGTIHDKDGKSYSYSSMSYEQFKQLKDVATATIKFEAAFERAGKPRLANRLQYAKTYYEMFTGKTYDIDPSIGTSDSPAIDGSTGSYSSNGTSSGSSVFNIISTITSAFTDAFNGKSSDDSFNASAAYGDAGSNVGTTVGTTFNPSSPNFNSKSPIDWMRSILGQISYSMEGPRNPDKGSADCSSTVRWAIKKAGGPDIGSTTADQLDSSSLSPVWDGNGSYATSAVENSMKPNDVIFFSRPTSKFTRGRKYRVGHVGLYEGNGKYIDHGSGMGPKEKDLTFGADGKIVRVSRIKTSGANSGIANYNDLALAAGGSSGLLIASRAGSNGTGTVAIRDRRIGRLVPARVSGGASDITQLTTNMLSNIKTDVTTKAKSGSISPELVAQLLQSITNILNTVANNTAPISKIYNALTALLSSGTSGSGSSMEKVTVKKDNKPQAISQSTEIDSNIATLVNTLAELAKG